MEGVEKVGVAPAQLARCSVIELCLGVVVYSDGESKVLVGAGGGSAMPLNSFKCSCNATTRG